MVRIRFGHTPETLRGPGVVRKVRNEAAPGRFLLKVKGIADYYAEDGRSITISPAPNADPDAVRVFLITTMIAVVLHQRGFPVLNASAVEKNDNAFLFAGTSGMGKSSTVAGLVRQGYTLLSDDMCCIKEGAGGFFALPGYPTLSLWKDTCDLFNRDNGHSGTAVCRVRTGMDKFRISGVEFQPKETPVKAIYILDRNDRQELAPLSGFDALSRLRHNVYRNGMLYEEGRNTSFFEFSGRLLESGIMMKTARTNRLMENYESFIDMIAAELEVWATCIT